MRSGESTCFEYEKVPDALADIIRAETKLHPYFTERWGEIRASNCCGIIRADGRDYYILPKISDNETQNYNVFIYMLMAAYDLKLKNEDISGTANHRHDLLEVLINLFASMLGKELQRGVYKEYVTLQDNLTTLRGKYLIGENIRRNVTHHKLYCEYDEFSPDNALNQFFLFAVKTLKPFVWQKKLLTEVELMLDEVQSLYIQYQRFGVTFNRLNDRYRKSYEVAMLLLERIVPLFEQGKQSFAFLFDMNELFEKFIARIIRDIEPTAKIQNENRFGNLVLKPDILIPDKLIIDTKYKKIESRDDLRTVDKYQMYVYGKNYGIGKTMLLYPEHLRPVCENLQLGETGKAIRLRMRSIDLMPKEELFQTYIEAIQKQMKLLLSDLEERA
jgi:5-methylcytosine-specific restriction enzyme subunit McrC